MPIDNAAFLCHTISNAMNQPFLRLFLLSVCLSIAIGLSLASTASAAATTFPPGTVVQALDKGTIYYIGQDGKRYLIPNIAVYRSWYAGFGAIKGVPGERELNRISKGKKPVTVRPGKTLVKFEINPKVYAVDGGGILRWIRNERLATQLYGKNWGGRIAHLPDSDRGMYTLGVDIDHSADFSRTEATAKAQTIDDELIARRLAQTKKLTTAGVAGDARLKSLKTDTRGLSPAFQSNTTKYTLLVKSTDERVILTPAAYDTESLIAVNDTVVPTGSPIAINLSPGLNTIAIRVTNSAGDARLYTILADRAPGNGNPYIKSLTKNLKAGLSPAFDPAILEYDLRADYLETNLTLRPTLQDSRGQIWVNDLPVKSGASWQLNLEPRENVVTIRAMAENGARKTYVIRVYRNPLPMDEDLNLRLLEENLDTSLSPAFEPNMTLYDVIAGKNEATVKMTARPNSQKAKIFINGEEGQVRTVPLTLGETEIAITVALDAGSTKTYTITVRKDED